MSEPAWKLVRTAALDGMCTQGCMERETATVALIDSGATQCFVSATLVAKFELPVKPGGSMEVMLADGS